MSILNRYKKTGGFKQLLELIESCGVKKRENLLRIINEEDEVWAEAINEKVLTIDKFFVWPDEYLLEVFPMVNHLTLAASLKILEKERADHIVTLLEHTAGRAVKDLLETKEFTASEISTSVVKVLTSVRQLMYAGKLKVDKFAPQLMVPQGIEEILERKSRGELGEGGASQKWLHQVETTLKREKNNREKDSANMKQIHNSFEKLKSRIIHLERENSTLQNEVSTMKSKLEKIKRIA